VAYFFGATLLLVLHLYTVSEYVWL